MLPSDSHIKIDTTDLVLVNNDAHIQRCCMYTHQPEIATPLETILVCHDPSELLANSDGYGDLSMHRAGL
jgi:hypothetical protein